MERGLLPLGRRSPIDFLGIEICYFPDDGFIQDHYGAFNNLLDYTLLKAAGLSDEEIVRIEQKRQDRMTKKFVKEAIKVAKKYKIEGQTEGHSA